MGRSDLECSNLNGIESLVEKSDVILVVWHKWCTQLILTRMKKLNLGKRLEPFHHLL